MKNNPSFFSLQKDFYNVLKPALAYWTGGNNHLLSVIRHPYWITFSGELVQPAIRTKYGDDLKLCRGIYGPVASKIMEGGDLPLNQFSSWTINPDFAKHFVTSTPGGAGGLFQSKKKDWAVVEAEFLAEDVVFAPVKLPDFLPDPDVLFHMFSSEAEFVIYGGRQGSTLSKRDFKVIQKTRRKKRADYFVVGGSVYKLAAHLSNIPSWEEVWESAKSTDATIHREEAYLNDRDEDNPDDVALAESMVKEDVWELYQGIVFMLHNLFEGSDCWREMKLENIDPITLDPLGVYWSYEKDAAEAHGGGFGDRVLYRARIDLDKVDVPYTVEVNVDLDTGPPEAEVGFQEGSRIWVYDVTLEDGTTVDINDWRRV